MTKPTKTHINGAILYGLRGLSRCVISCDACSGHHHWLPAFPDDEAPGALGASRHPAEALGLVAWFDCKHCEAWCEDIEAEEE